MIGAFAVLGFVAAAWAAVLGWGIRRWQRETVARVTVMRRAARAFSTSAMEVPPPVARYLRAALSEKAPPIRSARLRSRGDFLVRPPAGWKPFTAVQHFTARPPGFVWDARIGFAPGIDVRVRDSFVGHEGSMRAAILGILPLASEDGGGALGEAALQRFLAEAVWFPSALEPGDGLAWEPVDDACARATMTVDGVFASLEFHFGGDGLVDEVFAPARARMVDGKAMPTPWRGKHRDYARRDGFLVPTRAEVEWVFPQGPEPYWRGEIVEFVFER